jgi:hypothetical protein
MAADCLQKENWDGGEGVWPSRGVLIDLGVVISRSFISYIVVTLLLYPYIHSVNLLNC